METKSVLVSIGLPVYNGENFIREALDSVLSQTYTNFEIVISDNASTDKTEEICKEYAKKDSRIRYIRQAKNRGVFFNSHFVSQEAKGLYFTFLSHDDAFKEHFLEETVDYLSKHKECVLVSGDFEFVDESRSYVKNLELNETRENLPWKYRLREFFKYPTSTNIYILTFGLIKTDVIKKIFTNVFSPKAVKGSEVPVLCRIAAAGQIASIPKILRKYRLHNNSISQAEWLVIDKKPSFIKRFILFVNMWEIRFDQTKVLLSSKYPLTQKLDTLWWVYKQYLKKFLARLARFPKKFLK